MYAQQQPQYGQGVQMQQSQPMQQQPMVGVDVDGDGKADYMMPAGGMQQAQIGMQQMYAQQPQMVMQQQLQYGQQPQYGQPGMQPLQATTVSPGPQPVMGTPAPNAVKNVHNVIVKSKGDRSGNATCMYMSAICMLIVSVALLAGGAVVSAAAGEMNPEEDFEEVRVRGLIDERPGNIAALLTSLHHGTVNLSNYLHRTLHLHAFPARLPLPPLRLLRRRPKVLQQLG